MPQKNSIPLYNLDVIDNLIIDAISYDNPYQFKTPHRHNYYEILFFEKGGGYQIIDFEKVPIKDNSCYIIKPRQVHLMTKAAQADGLLIQFTSIMLLPDILEKSLNILHNYKKQAVLYEEDKDLTGLFLELATAMRDSMDSKSGYYKQKAAHSLCNFLYTLDEAVPESTTQKQKATDATLSRFLNNVETRLNSYSVKEYANELGIAPKKLADIVKEHLGISPLKYIHNRLLLEIKRDLMFKTLSHKEIAYNYNFDSPSNFSLFVKKHTGQTPTILQKSLNEQK